MLQNSFVNLNMLSAICALHTENISAYQGTHFPIHNFSYL